MVWHGKTLLLRRPMEIKKKKPKTFGGRQTVKSLKEQQTVLQVTWRTGWVYFSAFWRMERKYRFKRKNPTKTLKNLKNFLKWLSDKQPHWFHLSHGFSFSFGSVNPSLYKLTQSSALRAQGWQTHHYPRAPSVGITFPAWHAGNSRSARMCLVTGQRPTHTRS